MMDTTIEKELQEQVGQQRRVVDFARALAAKQARGVPGRALIRFGGLIGQHDLALIEQTVEAGCEQLNAASTPHIY